MIYALPTSLAIQGTEYAVRYDYRAVLDICIALNDPELSQQEKAEAALEIFYPDFEEMPPEHYREAIAKCFWFINGGEEEEPGNKSPRLVSWEQDFKLIAAPINRVLGREVRDIPYDRQANTGGFHWWSFLSAYMEIGGDCTFAQVVSLRDKLARHKKLDKSEREWLRRNRRLVEFKVTYTEAEDALVKEWTM